MRTLSDFFIHFFRCLSAQGKAYRKHFYISVCKRIAEFVLTSSLSIYDACALPPQALHTYFHLVKVMCSDMMYRRGLQGLLRGINSTILSSQVVQLKESPPTFDHCQFDAMKANWKVFLLYYLVYLHF